MLKIGNINLPGNLVLSPMAGVTDAPFRMIAKQNGADYTISEMITSDQALWNSNKTQWRLQDQWYTTPKIIQIAGASLDVVVGAAIKCEQIGAELIEINMGCPAKKVCNVLAGSALLKDENLVYNILHNTTKAVSIPVMLKTRLGWDHNQKNILTIAKIAEDANIQSLTIHGRTRADFYNGDATYDLIAEAKQQLNIPVFANGDIRTPEMAKHVLNYTKADGLYIGRAAFGNPWLFGQIKQYLTTGVYDSFIDFAQTKNTIIEHLSCIYQHYGEVMGVRIARKHVKWYWQTLANKFENFQNDFSLFSGIETAEQQLEFVLQKFDISH
jgi:tRNA-dihydrouridine synthase B